MLRAIAIFAFLCAPLIGAVPPGHAQERWTEYRSPAGGFRAEFPGAPQHDAADVSTAAGPVRMNISEVEVDGAAFMTIHVDYPPGAIDPDPQVALDNARDGGVKNVNGSLRHETRLTVSGVPARRAVIDIPEGNRVGHVLLVLSGSRLLQVIYVGPNGTENSDRATRFLNSFALIPK